MRHAWLIPLVIAPFAVACASGVGADALNSPPEARDSGAESGLYADGAPSYGSDTGTGMDTGTGTTTPDGAMTTLPDAGPGSSTDAGAPEAGGPTEAAALDSGTADAIADAPPFDGPVVLGESCSSPIDISAGGTFVVDTCSLTNSVAASCGTTAAAGILRGVAPMTGSTYSITFPSGWVLQELDDTCAPMSFDCGSTGTWGVSGATLGGYWYFAIEPSSGTCGSVSVIVDRIM